LTGIEGKYCLHFHKVGDCPDCIFENNVVENGHQRGIIVHGTHRSQVKNNIVYNVRGAGIYIEDGNEMHNTISYNVAICKFPFRDGTYHGCTIPGTSNIIADTSDNQAGIFSRAATNNLIGNRSANNFNGMFLAAGGRGRGESQNKVCEFASKMGRIEGNTFHGNGRFGTYTLGYNYPKITDQSIMTDGHNVDQSLCEGFDDNGDTRGAPVAFENNMDYHNAFVGHYEAGDIQYNGHQSYDNNNLIYWKETKVSKTPSSGFDLFCFRS
jgi:parallel beta-helix repeat protein